VVCRARSLQGLRECELLVFHARSLPDAEWVSIERPLLVTSPSEAHVGHLLPNCLAAPRLPGPFCDLNCQEDRWRCLPAKRDQPNSENAKRSATASVKMQGRVGRVHREPDTWRIGKPSCCFLGNTNRLGYHCNRRGFAEHGDLYRPNRAIFRFDSRGAADLFTHGLAASSDRRFRSCR
jgi:hypothetical protein